MVAEKREFSGFIPLDCQVRILAHCHMAIDAILSDACADLLRYTTVFWFMALHTLF